MVLTVIKPMRHDPSISCFIIPPSVQPMPGYNRQKDVPKSKPNRLVTKA